MTHDCHDRRHGRRLRCRDAHDAARSPGALTGNGADAWGAAMCSCGLRHGRCRMTVSVGNEHKRKYSQRDA